jgi:ribonuclease BN (tRNA processing enzyme)
VRYGGHTSCVAILGDDEVPRLILDAGTGLRDLPELLGGRPFRGDIVLTHLHWDHLQGLPFCRAVDRDDAVVRLHVPMDADGSDSAQALLARTFSPPFFPIGPDGLRGDWTFHELLPGPVDGLDLTVAPVAHKGGVTYGIRVELEGTALAYLPDHALHRGMPETLLRSAEQLATGADILLHDGQYSGSQQEEARAFGHATIEAAAEFADRCGVGRLAFTHHAPDRTDDALDALAAAWRTTPEGRPICFVRQGSVLS